MQIKFLWGAIILLMQVCLSALAQTPIASYPFNGNANDAIGSNNGTVNGATLTADRFGNANSAYAFDGVDDFISLPTGSVTNYTLIAWVKFDGSPSNKNLIVFTNASGPGGAWSSQMRTGNAVFQNYCYPLNPILLEGTTNISTSVWYHVTVSASANGQMKIYVNGQLDATPLAVSGTPWADGDRFELARASGDFKGFFEGVIDDVKIYNTQLTDVEVLADYTNNNIPETGFICGTASEGGVVTLTAPAGKVFTAVNFASYGTPQGTCGSFSLGSCHASSSKAIVEAAFIGKNAATISADNGVFGDPCFGTVKRLYIQATYGDAQQLAKYSGAFGNSVLLNGSSDYIDAGNNSAYNLTSAITVEAWIKPSAYNTVNQIIQKGGASGPGIDRNGYQLRLDATSANTSNLNFFVSDNNGMDGVTIPLTNTDINQWLHVAGVYNGTSIRIYKNGILVQTNTTTRAITHNTNSLLIGRRQDQWHFNGALDEIRIWSTARTQAEIIAAMNSQLAGNETGLVGYWDMNRSGAGVGLTVQNKATSTGAALDGTTFGTASTPVFEQDGCEVKEWFKDTDDDGYSDGTSVSQCAQPVGFKLAEDLIATSGDCNDNNPLINPQAQRFAFTGATNFTDAIVHPLQGTSYTNYKFEVAYFDATGALPPPSFPRLLLDFEGNGIFTDPNDRGIIMTPVDVNDNNTEDGKRYFATVNTLPNGANWKVSVQSGASGCVTRFGPFDSPDVLVLPDLQIFANKITFSNPAPDISTPITVSAVIENVSDFEARNFRVRLINEFNPAIDYGDIVVANLPARSSNTLTWNIVTPDVPAWCPMRVVVDSDDDIDESDENNNNAVRPFNNGNFPIAGRIAATIGVTPQVSLVASGNIITVSGFAYYQDVAVPLVDTSAAGAEIRFTVQETGQTFTGYTNARGLFSISFVAPLAAGTYHINGSITDFTLTGPITGSFTLIQNCRPDLTASVLLSARSIAAGQSVTGSLKVTNAGCAPVGATRVQLSQTGGTAIPLGFAVPALAPGESFHADLGTITFATVGNFSICATADADFEVDEASEGNNTFCQEITVLPALPDINILPTRPEELFNCTGTVPVSFTLRNSGGIQTGPFNTLVQIKQADNIVQTFNVPVTNIQSLGLATLSVPFAPPASGSYTVTLFADNNNTVTELREDNNQDVFALEILTCKPDLIVAGCSGVDALSENTSYTGTMQLVATIINQGNATANGPIDVRFAFSNGVHFDTQIPGNLAANGGSAVATVTIPAFINVDTSLTVLVDFNNQVEEFVETNNASVPKRTAWELFPTEYDPSCGTDFWERTIIVNQPVNFRVAIVSRELYNADSVEVKFEVSGPGIDGFLDLGLGYIFDVNETCVPCPNAAVLPFNYAFPQVGAYTIRMTVDPNNKYREVNENNNVLIVTAHVTDLPDMRILSQYINPSKLNPQIGEEIEVSVTYENMGSPNISDQMKIKLLINNEEHETIYPVQGLVTNDKRTVKFNIPWSSTIPGAHIIRAIIDSDDQVNEITNLNNEATRAVIVGAASNLFFRQFSANNLIPEIGETIEIDVAVENNGAQLTTADIQLYYVDNLQNEILIDSRNLEVNGYSFKPFKVNWVVADKSTRIIARIVNTANIEFNEDDNEASFDIGKLEVVLDAKQACAPGSIGSLTAVATGGEAPYRFRWSGGSTSATQNGTTGDYTVVVTDWSGTTVTVTGTILACSNPCVTETSRFTETACDSYTWEGTIYTASGEYVKTFPNRLGCDSVVTLVLTIRNSVTWFKDTDNDGYSDGTQQTQCDRPAGFKLATELAATSGDCRDNDATVFPGAPELCDGKDNNCNGTVDEGCPTGPRNWYRDRDGDGFGMDSWVKVAETQPVGFVAASGDCNDTDATIYPGAPELEDGKDNNCDGQIDEDLGCRRLWYRDVDGDGLGRGNWTKLSCIQPEGFVTTSGDCKDLDPTVYPGAPELPDGKDNNCNGQVDEGLPCLKTWYRDVDGDGIGRDNWTRQSCIQPAGFVDRGGDCRDWDPAIYPGAPELCDGKDNDCDGQRDEECIRPIVATNAPRAAQVANEGNALSVTIWPNPATTAINITLNVFEPGKKVELVLAGADGRNLQSLSVIPEQPGQRVQMSVRGLAPGYYLLRAHQGALYELKKIWVVR